MANEQTPAGPVQHLITVHCDFTGSTLELNLPAVAIKPGDGVVWQFFGIPDQWNPWIELSPGTHFLGPFVELTQSGAAVWGTCKEDPGTGPFVYRATVQKGQGTAWDTGAAAIHSAAGTLVLDSGGATSHQFTVTQGDGVLDITPSGVIIEAGDTVEWVFQDIQEDRETWRPTVEFHHYDGKGAVSDLYLGPFTSLTTGTDRVRGMGNNHVAGSYYFQVSVVRLSDGAILWISSKDPVIDNRGIVIDPGGSTKR
jgi:hypothetical protein